MEIVLDLSDSMLSGSGESPDYMDLSLSRLQIRLNDTKMKIDSYRSCQKDEYLDDLKIKYCTYYQNNDYEKCHNSIKISCNGVLKNTLTEVVK